MKRLYVTKQRAAPRSPHAGQLYSSDHPPISSTQQPKPNTVAQEHAPYGAAQTGSVVNAGTLFTMKVDIFMDITR